ncbi:RNA recognition motif-containing protein, partial [Diplocarpon rosae]
MWVDLDAAHVQYSYKHSTLVMLTVEGAQGQRNSPAEGQDWHLPAFDPRNETKYMYPLHTLDLYFWTREDAVLHREKTPPPEDGAVNPLMAAAASDQGPTLAAPYQQHAFPGPPPQPPQQQSYFANVPLPSSAPPSQLHSSPPPAVPISPFAQHFQTSFAPPPTASSPYAQPPPASVTATPPAYQQQQPPQPSHPPAYKPAKEAKAPKGNLEKRAGQLEKG